ncbi:hypothetical protein OAK94_00565 [bacterium]|nr:hypothetical protein [bacterium]
MLTDDRLGESQKAFYFGGNNKIEVPPSSALSDISSYSITFWVKIDNTNRTSTLIRKGSGTTSNTSFDIYHRPTDLTIVHNRGIGNYGFDRHEYKKPISSGNWHFISVIYDSSNKNINTFIDGLVNLKRSVPLESPAFDPTSGFSFGDFQVDGINGPQGALDDIRIYNRALSDAEVATLYHLESENSKFQIVEGNFTWHEAKADAEAKGGRLAVLDTQEKIDAANTYLEELGEWPNVWIGATDEVNEGDWRWITGVPLTINAWDDGEPSNAGPFGPEHHAHIWRSNDNRRLQWNDISDEEAYSYLLEILERPPAPPVVELDSFYESNPQEEIVVDATPTEGFPEEFTYQWSFNGQPIPSFLGGTLPTFNFLGDQSQNGTWTVVVSNTVGTTEASFEYRMFVDNDSDGLSNYREENITLTNPDLADSDADGLSDPDELSIHGTDPNVADVDEDGLNDSEEIAATTDPSVADTDNDGLLDGAEVKTYASNPKSGDTDNDGIADAAEVAAGLDINTAESIADAVAFLTQELANRPPVDGFEEAIAAARTTGREDVTSNPSLYSLYDQTAYNTVIAERDARLTLEEVKDGRLGSVLLLPDAQTNIVRLRFCIEESDELGQWIAREEEAEVEIPLDPNKKFFRFSVKEDE